MAAPLLLLESLPLVTSTVDLTAACGGPASKYGQRGYDGSDWILGSNGGYQQKLWGDDQLSGISVFADSGTLPFKNNAFSGYTTRAQYLQNDEIAWDDLSGATPTLIGVNQNWIRWEFPQINSGIRWALRADQQLRQPVFSLYFEGGYQAPGTWLATASLSDSSVSTRTLTLLEGQQVLRASWRAAAPGATMNLELRKTNAGVGLIGVEFAYMPVPTAPARPRGFRNAFANRAAFGGRNE